MCGSKHFMINNEKSRKCDNCGFTYYANPCSATAAFIINEDGEMLVVRRGKEPAKGTLDLPGGFADMDETLEEAMPELDILYMTRAQKERFFNEEDYIRLKDSYILDLEKLQTAKEDLTIMHPLPRVNEISVEVDDDPRACYFFQALCGKHIRMALILFLLGIKREA